MANKKKTFGSIAIEMGYLTEEVLSKALKLQSKEQGVGRYPRLGVTLLKMGALTSTQLIEIMVELERQSKEENDGK